MTWMGNDREHTVINEHEESQSLVELLVLGTREIEQGRFRSAKEVFADLDKEDDTLD